MMGSFVKKLLLICVLASSLIAAAFGEITYDETDGGYDGIDVAVHPSIETSLVSLSGLKVSPHFLGIPLLCVYLIDRRSCSRNC